MKLTRTTAGHPYQALAAQIVAKIRSGELKPDQALPTIRALAKMYETTGATAQRAVQQLAQDGYIKTVPNVGSFVLPLHEDDSSQGAQPLEQRVAALEADVADLRKQLQGLTSRRADGGDKA